MILTQSRQQLYTLMPQRLYQIIIRQLISRADRIREYLEPSLSNYLSDEMNQVKYLDLQTKKPLVICLIGLPQTGKTTVANIVARTLGLIRINNNQIRDWLELSPFSSSINANGIGLMMLEQMLHNNYGVVMDSDHADVRKRILVENCVQKYDAEIIYLRVLTDYEIWIKRLKDSNHEFHALYHRSVMKSCSGSQGYEKARVTQYFRGFLVEAVEYEYRRHLALHQCLDGKIPGEHRPLRNNLDRRLLEKAARLESLRILSPRWVNKVK